MFFCFIDNNHSIQEKGYKNEAVISENDEWRDEKEWDEVFEQMQKERQNL